MLCEVLDNFTKKSLSWCILIFFLLHQINIFHFHYPQIFKYPHTAKKHIRSISSEQKSRSLCLKQDNRNTIQNCSHLERYACDMLIFGLQNLFPIQWIGIGSYHSPCHTYHTGWNNFETIYFFGILKYHCNHYLPTGNRVVARYVVHNLGCTLKWFLFVCLFGNY